MLTTSDVIHSEKQENEKTRFHGLNGFQNWVKSLISDEKSPSREITVGC